MNRIKIIIAATVFILCAIFIFLTNKTSQIYVGNSYENSRDINVTITLNNSEILYDGFLKSYGLPFLVKKRDMKSGFYKVTAYLKSDNKKVEAKFFYFYQSTIWIDFDMTQKNPLFVSAYYTPVPL